MSDASDIEHVRLKMPRFIEAVSIFGEQLCEVGKKNAFMLEQAGYKRDLSSSILIAGSVNYFAVMAINLGLSEKNIEEIFKAIKKSIKLAKEELKNKPKSRIII